MTFETTLLVGWADLDANGHMANTAYLNKAVDARAQFLATVGFSQAEFARRGFGPVVRKDEIEYFRELRFHDEVRATVQLAGISADGRKALWRNDFHRGEELSARVTSLLGILDLQARVLVAPPEDLLEAINRLPRTDDFVELTVSSR